MVVFSSLLTEIQLQILLYVAGGDTWREEGEEAHLSCSRSLLSLALTSKDLAALAIPLLYRTVVLESEIAFTRLLRKLSREPSLALNIRTLAIFPDAMRIPGLLEHIANFNQFKSLKELEGGFYMVGTDADQVKSGLEARELKKFECGLDPFRMEPVRLPSTLNELSLEDDFWLWRRAEGGDPGYLQFSLLVGRQEGLVVFPPHLQSLSLVNLPYYHKEAGLDPLRILKRMFSQVGPTLLRLSLTFASTDPSAPCREDTFPPLLHLLPHLASLHISNCSVEPVFSSSTSQHPTLQLLSIGDFLPSRSDLALYGSNPRHVEPIEDFSADFREDFYPLAAALQLKFIDKESPQVIVLALEWKSRFPSLNAIQIRSADWREYEQSRDEEVWEAAETLGIVGIELWDGRGVAWTGREARKDDAKPKPKPNARQVLKDLQSFAAYIQPRFSSSRPAAQPSPTNATQSNVSLPLPNLPLPPPSPRPPPRAHRSATDKRSSPIHSSSIHLPNIQYFLSQLPLCADPDNIPPSLPLDNLETPPDLLVEGRLSPASARDLLIAWNSTKDRTIPFDTVMFGREDVTRRRRTHEILDAMLDDDRLDAIAAISLRKYILLAIREGRITGSGSSPETLSKQEVYAFLASLPAPARPPTIDADGENHWVEDEGEDDVVSSDDEELD